MNETKTHAKTDFNIKMLAAVIAAFVLIVSGGVIAFIKVYSSYIDNILYHERLKQMQEVTTQLYNGLEDVVQNKWDTADVFCNYVELGKPADADTLVKFMGKQAALNNMDGHNDDKLVAVDELGRYLTQDGWQGTLTSMDLLQNKPEQVSFIEKSVTTEKTTMYFLNRLSEPVTMSDGSRTVNIIYYGTAQDMAELDHYFRCEAYGNSNSVYVLDTKGIRVFSSSDLLPGYNAYSVLERMEYLHDTSFDVARRELDEKGLSYSNAVFDGEEYYYSLYKMDNAEWVLLFLVPSEYVAQDTVSLVKTTEKMVLVFALILLVITTVVIFQIVRFKQRQVLNAERKNSDSLARMNEELSEALTTAENAEREAKEANKAKSEFLSNMSHDIRTPMNAIVGISKLMEHERNDPEKLEYYIHKVQGSSRHLLSLINDVLDMSKIESGGVTLNHEPVSLAEQVAQVDSMIRPQAEERRQNFTVRVDNVVHEYLIGDAVRLRQVFINLLSNAVKYTPNGGDITLELSEKPCGIPDCAEFSISVTDTGYGMAPEFVEHIFEPFTRAENSTTNKVQGTGLGMAITKNIVDLMGGSISVQSELDKGSRFEVNISLATDSGRRGELPFKNVLLISDKEDLVRNVRAAFSETDAVLTVAGTEEEADAVLAEGRTDTVLLGGSIQGQKLSENLRRLRERTGGALLIYCCDYSERDEAAKIREKEGVDGIISRPFFLSNMVRAAEHAKNRTSDRVDEESSVLRGMKFLCAEDNALNAEILEALMDMNGASCVIYPNGKALVEAFAQVKQGDFDAILMDVQMPVMNGLEATRAVRRGENPLGKTIPIIAMTANAFSSDVQSCLDAGMDAHVSKPLEIAVLERTIRSIWHRRTI